MAQNISTAVMQRNAAPNDLLNDFPTPPWATRALLGFLAQQGLLAPLMTAREPAANRGHMVRPLREVFGSVDASDVFDYGAGFDVRDYLFGPDPGPVNWTITNPPFRLAEQFVQRMRATSTTGCAVLVRSAFIEGEKRHARLFSVTPPRFMLQFSERVVIHKGRLAPEGSTATAYCWLIWTRAPVASTALHWIPPCRREMERDGDYLPAALIANQPDDEGKML